MMNKNFKHAIKTKEEVLLLNCLIDITRSQMEVALGNGEYDAVYFDGQHRPISDDKIAAFCEHAEALGMPVQMRLPHTRHSYLVDRYCDFGLSSIMVLEVGRNRRLLRRLSISTTGRLGVEAGVVLRERD